MGVSKAAHPTGTGAPSGTVPAATTSTDAAAPPRAWTGRVLATATIAAAVASLVFEQSPANEALRTNVGLDVLQRSQSAVAVGLVVAAVTVIIELVPALLITAGLHQPGGPVEWLKRRMIQRAEARERAAPASRTRRPRRYGTLGADMAVALGLGAGIVTLRRHVADPHPTVAGDLRASGAATAVVAVASGAIGYLLAGGLAHADSLGLGVLAGWIIDYGADTRFWVTVLVVGYLIVLARRRIHAWSVRRRPPALASSEKGTVGAQVGDAQDARSTAPAGSSHDEPPGRST